MKSILRSFHFPKHLLPILHTTHSLSRQFHSTSSPPGSPANERTCKGEDLAAAEDGGGAANVWDQSAGLANSFQSSHVDFTSELDHGCNDIAEGCDLGDPAPVVYLVKRSTLSVPECRANWKRS